MDFLSGVTPSVPGLWTGCVVVCDRFSRMIHVKECPSHPTAEEAARLFIYLVVARHGIPAKIISDRGTQFESAVWRETVERLGSRVALATTHHPQTNGITERANRTLLQMIRRVCVGRGASWVKWLPLLEFAYNSSVHSSTKVSPFFVNHGYCPQVPASFLSAPVTTSVNASQAQAVTRFCQQLQEQSVKTWEEVRKSSERAGRQAEERENRKRGGIPFKKGDEVLCYQGSVRRGLGEEVRKQQLKYAGPYLVKEVGSTGWVELEGVPPHMPIRYNCELLKPYRRCLSAEPWREVAPPPRAELMEGETQWEVEAILAERKKRRGRDFLVKWRGYSRPTWEPEGHLTGCEEAIKDFMQRLSHNRRS